MAQVFVAYGLRFPARYKVVFLVQDQRETADDRWFIEDTDVVPELKRFSRLIAAARGVAESDTVRDGEALLCAMIGVGHLLIGMPEYRWAEARAYVDRILRGFL